MKKKYEEYRYYHGSEEAQGVMSAFSKLSKKDIYSDDKERRPSLLDDDVLFFDNNDSSYDNNSGGKESFLADDDRNYDNSGGGKESFLADDDSNYDNNRYTDYSYDSQQTAGSTDESIVEEEAYADVNAVESPEAVSDVNSNSDEGTDESEYITDDGLEEESIKVDENSLGYLVGAKATEAFLAGIKDDEKEEDKELYLVEVDSEEEEEPFIVDDRESKIEAFLSEFRKGQDEEDADYENDYQSTGNKKKINKKKKKYKK